MYLVDCGHTICGTSFRIEYEISLASYISCDWVDWRYSHLFCFSYNALIFLINRIISMIHVKM